MKLEQWVLFLDMLGYREINGEIIDDSKADDFISFMNNNVAIFESQNLSEKRDVYKLGSFDLYEYYDVQTTFVSDSLIINYKPKEHHNKISEKTRMLHSANALLIILNRLQTYMYHCLKEKSILIRGGVSNKYCSIDKNFAVGEGLIEAYMLESKVAVFPRIVLSNDIVSNDGLISSLNIISNFIYKVDSFLKTDSNGVTFLDYLKFNIALAYSVGLSDLNTLPTVNGILVVYKDAISVKLIAIERDIVEAKDDQKKIENLEKVQRKILWLKGYYNESVRELLPQFVIE